MSESPKNILRENSRLNKRLMKTQNVRIDWSFKNVLRTI